MQELPIEVGQLVAGKYRIERVLGSGAMGVVVAAWHEELQQRVAVKFVRPEAMALRDAEERFRREARAAARIRSEHVGRVVDVGSVAGGIPFMVMEFLDGNDLSEELLRRGPLPFAEVCGYVLEAIEALAEAHAAGIVHRDLKPANLFLSRRPDGSRVLKVLDFGVSKSSGSRMGDLALTQHAAMIGSPLYMAPEQMRSARDVDARADIWSLGIILFELLSGRPPYMGDSIAELITAMLESPRSLRGVRPDVPEALDRIVSRCLQRDAGARYSDVSVLAQALVEFAPEHRLQAERARRVLGGRDAVYSADSTAGTLAASAAAAAARPTIAAWGDSQTPRERRSRVRRVGVLVGIAGGLMALGAGIYSVSRSAPSGPPASGAPNGVALPTPNVSNVTAALPTAEVRPPEPPSVVETPPADAPLGGAAPMMSAHPAKSGTATKAPAAKAPPKLAERPPAVAAPLGHPATPKDDLPDFGGRR